MKVSENICSLIRTNKITFSKKAISYIAQNKYSLIDFKNAVLNGYMKKKEKDETNISDYKYTILGPALNGKELYTCGKIILMDGKKYFFITIHEAD